MVCTLCRGDEGQERQTAGNYPCHSVTLCHGDSPAQACPQVLTWKHEMAVGGFSCLKEKEIDALEWLLCLQNLKELLTVGIF